MPTVGPALRCERFNDLTNTRAKSGKHVCDHVIPADQDTICLDLRRQMTVADMPGQHRQRARGLAAHLKQRFLRRNHLDTPPVVQHQPIAITKRRRLRQINQHPLAPIKHQHLSPQMTFIVSKNEPRGRSFGSVMRNSCCTQHVESSGARAIAAADQNRK